MNGEDFPGYFARNLALYVVWLVLWAVPAIAVLGEFTRDDGPPLLAATWSLLFALSFAAVFLVPQLFAVLLYLAIVWWSPTRHRRLVAVALSPLAVGLLILAVEDVPAAVAVVAAGATFGASLWLPTGVWWQRRPLLVAAGAAWVAMLAAIGLVQPLSAGIQSDVRVTARDGARVARYRLTCEYDRAGRLRGAGAATTHPGGTRACELLDDVYEGVFNGPPVLQEGCRPGAPVARFAGVIHGRRVELDVIRGPCDADWFADDQTGALVPSLP